VSSCFEEEISLRAYPAIALYHIIGVMSLKKESNTKPTPTLAKKTQQQLTLKKFQRR